MVTGILCGGLALVVVLLVAIYRRLGALPIALRAQVKRERAVGQAQALTALQEAAAAKVGPITASIRAYEEGAATRYREEVAAAEVRARMAERRASNAVPVLGAASELVRDLRRTLDDVLALGPQVAARRSAAVTPVPDSGARVAIEVRRCACGGGPPCATPRPDGALREAP